MSFNYHKGVSSNISRGRGFSSRGNSFRGRGSTENGSSSFNSGNYSSGPGWSSSSRVRGNFTPSSSVRGRANWYNKEHSSSYESRKFTSNSPINQSERYSIRGRGDDSSYRHYSRIEGPGYSSSRDHGHHRSPEGSRKRVRSEHSFIQPSSSRRSHENNYSGSSEYSNRYSGYNEDKSGYGDERGRGGSSAGNSSYRDEGRRSSGGFRSERSRGDDYHSHRKPDQPDSSMPPPSSGSRGGYRGRMMRGSGRGSMSRILLRRQEMLARKKSDFLARKRLLGRIHSETLRKIKMQKMRRFQRAKEDKEILSDNERSDDQKEENWDDDDKDDKEQKDDAEKKKSKEKEKDVEKDKEVEEGEEVEDEEEGGSEPPKKKKKTSESEGRHNSESRNISSGPTRYSRPYIKLACPHCYRRFITFNDYTKHLYSPKHHAAMHKRSIRLKETLASMRLAQRANQRLLDAKEPSGSQRSHFCHICKLNYRQLKAKHAASNSHREMKKFLNPFCRICRIGCKSPMSYQNHLCSLEHIRLEARLKELGDKKRHSSEERSQEEEDYLTLSSIGVVDDSSNPEDEIKTENTNIDKQKEIQMGVEFVKSISAQYCELCITYLPRGDKEKILVQHCRTRTHIKRYLRNRKERSLNKETESVKKTEKENDSKKKKLDSNKKSDENDHVKEEINSPEKSTVPLTKRSLKGETNVKENCKTEKDETIQSGTDNKSVIDNEGEVDAEDADAMDDKLWADVDKDLGELLREVEPGNKSSDEDEDSRAGGVRYDRFRQSEKERANSSVPSSEPDGTEKPSNETLENQPNEEAARTIKIEDETSKSTSRNNSPNKEETSQNAN